MNSERPAFKKGKITSSSSSAPFFIVPAAPTIATSGSSGRPAARSVSFAKPAPVAGPKPAPIIVDPATLVSYKAPAHKHAHHLHSIPPREKTAKTLILDHMLWQHTRARFLQARSELGLPPTLAASNQQQQSVASDSRSHSPIDPYHSDGPSSWSSYSVVGRDTDESDADAESDDRSQRPPYDRPRLLSDLEADIRALKFGVRGFDRVKAYLEQAQDRFADTVDLETANVQRATAEGMEKVLSSLLTQSFTATSHSEHGHTGADGKPCLCHNVRMRVELSALVNDFFARDNIMTGSHRDSDCSDMEDESDLESNVRHDDLHQQPSDMSRTQSPMSISSLVVTSRSRPPSPPISTISRSANAPRVGSDVQPEPTIPPSLLPLLSTSSYAPPTQHIFNVSDPTGRAGPMANRNIPPPNSIFSVVPRGAGPDSPWALGPGNGMGWPARVPVPTPSTSTSWGPQGGNGGEDERHHPRVWKAIGRSRELFNGGVGRGRARAQPSSGTGGSMDAQGASLSSAAKEKDASAVGTGAAIGRSACPRHLRSTDACPQTCVHNTRSTAPVPIKGSATTIGAGLRSAGPPLRRPTPSVAKSAAAARSRSRVRARSYSSSTQGTSMSSQTYSNGKSASTSSSYFKTPPPTKKSKSTSRAADHGDARMADILPRFLRFSALIAKELGREARETGEQRVVDVQPGSTTTPGTTPSSPTSTTSSGFASPTRPLPPPKSRSNQRHGASSYPQVPIHLQPSTTGDARPTRAWYALLCGIVTRAVLEGYIRGKWKGADALEVLFGLGLGNWVKPSTAQEPADSEDVRSNSRRNSVASAKSVRSDTDVEMRDELLSEDSDESFDSSESSSYSSSSSDEEDHTTSFASNSPSFEPDGMPSIEEAVRILFGRGIAVKSQRDTPMPDRLGMGSGFNGTSQFAGEDRQPTPRSSSKRFISPGGTSPWSRGPMVRPGVGGSDPDWEWETSERISEFATISLSSPDLLTHLQELSRNYPPEPVERAALRFFEGVAEWRGVPELEAYKARRTAAAESKPTAESNIGSAPSSPNQGARPHSQPLPPILGYFTIPKELHRPIPTTPSVSSSSLHARKRSADDSSAFGGVRTAKSARSGAAIPQGEVEPSWTGPYGV